MTKKKFKTATRTSGANAAIKDGTVKPKTFDFEFEEVPVIIDAFRRMVRGNEFDICEMAITTYITAKEFGKPFTAVPLFIVRGFHHGAILVNKNAGIKSPKDLEGKKVGVNRGYTVTTGVWVRYLLASQYGVDLNKVTWVLSGDEHVAEYKAPSNVVPIEPGKKLDEMLASGEIVAAIGVESKDPNVGPLIPNAAEAALNLVRDKGLYLINHTVVIKDELIAANPDLAADLFNTFAEAKKLYVEKLKAGAIEKPDAADEMAKKVMALGQDPMPYGLEANRKVMTELLATAKAQGIITKPFTVDDLFVPSTRALKG
jgi:4,5-dihydroxyphthalate decarboxylase